MYIVFTLNFITWIGEKYVSTHTLTYLLLPRDYDAQGLTYLFDLDYQTSEGLEVDEGMFTIDAAFYGNTSHFINHSVS